MRPAQLLPLFALLGLLACSQPRPRNTDPALVGCWESRSARVEEADKTRSEQRLNCTLEFLPDRYVSQCLDKPGTITRVESSYVVQQRGLLNATIASDSSRLRSAGTSYDVEYQIVGDQMYLTRHPVDDKPVPSSRALTYETVNVRKDSSQGCRPAPSAPSQ
jgi:hypothetical protein